MFQNPITLPVSNPEKYKIAISESQLKIKQLYTLSSVQAIAKVESALNTSGTSLVSSVQRRGRRDRNDRKKSSKVDSETASIKNSVEINRLALNLNDVNKQFTTPYKHMS